MVLAFYRVLCVVTFDCTGIALKFFIFIFVNWKCKQCRHKNKYKDSRVDEKFFHNIICFNFFGNHDYYIYYTTLAYSLQPGER